MIRSSTWHGIRMNQCRTIVHAPLSPCALFRGGRGLTVGDGSGGVPVGDGAAVVGSARVGVGDGVGPGAGTAGDVDTGAWGLKVTVAVAVTHMVTVAGGG